jgi:hypothetical protein
LIRSSVLFQAESTRFDYLDRGSWTVGTLLGYGFDGNGRIDKRIAVLRRGRFLVASVDDRMREFFFEQLQTRTLHEVIRPIWPFPLDP